jgi:pimeloyl-ACP methyl ester carboxylesterase
MSVLKLALTSSPYKEKHYRGGVSPLFFVLLLATLMFPGCASQVTDLGKAISGAGIKGSQIQEFRTPSGAPIHWVHLNRVENNNVTFYIEGDGDAYVSRTRPSKNPTPTNPLALNLALADRSENVFYLARPCQFVPSGANRSCRSPVWTTERFSPATIKAYVSLLNRIISEHGFRQVTLVGFSGGASIVLGAAPNVKHLALVKTVAGYITRKSLNRSKGVPTNYAQTDPFSNLQDVVSIPQIHFSGSRDKVIPTAFIREFSKKVTELGGCSRHIEVATDHLSDWKQLWLRLVEERPKCLTSNP